MTSRDFCFWLQGLFELHGPDKLNEAQTALIKSHLSLVFIHEIDPSMGPPAHQADLNKAHEPVSLKPPKPSFDPHSTMIRC